MENVKNSKKKQPLQLQVFSVIFRVTDDSDRSSEIIEQFRRIGTQDYIFQLEKASHYHYQCIVKLKRKDRTRPAALEKRFKPLQNKRKDVGGVGVKPASTSGIEDLRSYCMKQDETYVKGPWTQRFVYTGQDLAIMEEPLAWHKQLLAMLAQEPNRRTIVWVTNLSGDVGKTVLCKWLRMEGRALRIPMGTATQLKTSCIAKGAHRCYTIDFPRTLGYNEKVADCFSAIEEIKNGWVESAMYGKVQELMMMPPHVFCFANWYPDVRLVSKDRWKIYTVETLESRMVPYVYFPQAETLETIETK